MAGGARGWLRVGQAFGALLLPGLGLAAPAPRLLGTQPPCATQALNFI